MPPVRTGLSRPRNYASRAQASRPQTSSSTHASSSSSLRRASQTQAREQLQSQRLMRGRAADDVEPQDEEQEEDDGGDDDDDDGDGDVGGDDQDEGGDDGDDGGQNGDLQLPERIKLPVSESVRAVLKALGKAEVERKINEMVRFALFSEYRRQPIRRDDITKKVLGKNASRAFPYIFNRAQAKLRGTFCYELVEMRPRGGDREQLLSQAAADAKAAASQHNGDGQGDAARKERASANTSSKVYMLRNIAPAKLLEAVALPRLRMTRPDLYPAEGPSRRPMVDWDKADGQLGSMGLTFLILSLILLNGRTLPDDQFRALLHRLGLEKAAQLPASLCPDSLAAGAPQTQAARSSRDAAAAVPSDSTSHPTTLSSFLNQLLKQGYLETYKNTTAAAAGGASSSRGRRRAGADDEGRNDSTEGLEWRWGPRADAEIGETAVAEFVRTVYVDCEDGGGGRGVGGGGDAAEGEDAAASEDDDDAANTSQWRAAPRASYGGRSANSRRTQQRTQQTQLSRQERDKRQKESQALLREIERAAGSQLLG